MKLEIWVDPVCPWCWLTSRWAIDVAPHRDLDIQWRSISLKVKNRTEPGSRWYEPVAYTHSLLRVMESLRAAEGNEAVGRFYTTAGTHIHHNEDRAQTADALLAEAGLDRSHAAAFDDESWDTVIEAAMNEGLALTGDDVGTPILAFANGEGTRVGFFGPVISRRLPVDQSLQLWDGMVAMAETDSFWELKRTRVEGPDFTPVS